MIKINVIVEIQDLNKVEMIDSNYQVYDELDDLIAVGFKVKEINNRNYTLNLLGQMIPSLKIYGA